LTEGAAANRGYTGPRWFAIAGAVAAAAAGLLLWIGRGSLFSVDDLLWFMGSPGLDIEAILEPHNGHLIATARVLHHFVYELFGADYAAIRVLTAASAAFTGLLFFAWASRRVARPLALAGMALLLLLGSSYIFLIAGDGLMVQLALAAGIGALLAIERRDGHGDALACALLCFGVVTYSVALGFVAAVGVILLLDAERRRALWVVVPPLVVYGAWWLWAQGQSGGTGQEADLVNLLLLPAYAFAALSSALGALTGLDYEFGSEQVRPEFDTTVPTAGPVLAVLAIAALAWRVRRGPLPPAAWGALAYLLSLWAIGALTTDAASPPEATRLVLLFGIGIILVAAAAAEGTAIRRRAMIATLAVAACGIAVNLALLIDGGEWRRDVDGPQLRAELTAVELARESAAGHPDLSRVADGGAIVNFPFSAAPLEDYVAAVDSHGTFGWTAEELRAQPEDLRTRADAMLLSVYGTGLTPAGSGSPSASCEDLEEARPGGGVVFELPADGALLESTDPVAVAARRFATEETVEVGELQPGVPSELRVPGDAAPDRWTVHAAARSVRVCGL
jgi:hypothetical protein